jgi:hypothetical protein
MTGGIVHKSPLPPGMTFKEALARFIQTDARRLKYPKRPKKRKRKRKA